MNPHIERILERDEGLRLKVYDDANGAPITKGDTLKGYPTVGIGRNLSGNGISDEEARYLLRNDIDRVDAECRKKYPWFANMDHVRQAVILSLRFNMGPVLDTFVNTLACIARADYEGAANNLTVSRWRTQVGDRATRLIYMLRTGDLA